jgi:hypothetical protein
MGIDVTNVDSINLFTKNEYNNNYMKKYIEGAVLQVNSHLQQIQYCLRDKPELKLLENSLPTTNNSALKYLQEDAGDLRRRSAHESIFNPPGKRKISAALVNFIWLKDVYFTHMESQLKSCAEHYKYHPSIYDFLTQAELNYSKKPLDIDNESDDKDEINSTVITHGKRNSQLITTDPETYNKKPKERKSEDLSDTSSTQSKPHANPWEKFDIRHSQIVSPQNLNKPNEPTDTQPTTDEIDNDKEAINTTRRSP